MPLRHTSLLLADTISICRWKVTLWCKEEVVRAEVERCLQGISKIDVGTETERDRLLLSNRGEGVVVFFTGEDAEAEAEDLNLLRTLKAANVCLFCIREGDGHGDLGSACRALLAGADYELSLRSACFEDELTAAVEQAASRALASYAEERSLRATMREVGFVGESPQSLALFRDVHAVSGLTGLPVLITGETGTGKELVANAVHKLDARRRGKPLVSLNCAALPEALFESELFGHTRGAFTGADRERPGLLRMAHGGMLFLDEIGELSLTLQAKLLRILQTGMIRSLGSDRETTVDVRLLAATNRDLERMVHEGSFREDLLHRINVLTLKLLPLRERPADVASLVQHCLLKHQNSCRSGTVPEIAPAFLHALETYAMPGNARQLENLVCRALMRWEGRTALSLRDLPEEIWQGLLSPAAADRHAAPQCQPAAPPANKVSGEDDVEPPIWNLKKAMQRAELELVHRAVEAAAGNQSKAARLLGITPRSVYNKLHGQSQHE
jgi:transcriptional regulator with GAF, ATPase, and Fis domain